MGEPYKIFQTTESRWDKIVEGKKVEHSIVDTRETNGQISDERLKSTTISKGNMGLRESNPAAFIPKFKKIISEMGVPSKIFHTSESRRDKREEGKKDDHSSVQKKDTDGQDQTSDKTSKSFTIFKVHVGLSGSNLVPYTPQLISIGPYHSRSGKLHSMEIYKQLYLQQFLERKEGIDKKICMRELEILKYKALACYHDNVDKDIVGKFVEIMLLDGCFLVEFIRERCGMLSRGKELYQPVIDKAWKIDRVLRDMVLLENQLPFFVLTKLYDMTKGPNEESFLYMVKDTLFDVSPEVAYIRKSRLYHLDAGEFDHLLHVVHVISCRSMITSRQRTDASNKKGFFGKILQIAKRSKEIPVNPDQCSNIPSARELYEAGVRFAKIGSVFDRWDTTTLLDIKFDNALLEIPCFRVDDSTETFLRNLIAFEQNSSNVEPYFSDYAQIMSQLIKSRKDAQLLRENGIIQRADGKLSKRCNDNVVATIFNRLSDGLQACPDKFYYREVCGKLNQHCQMPQNKMMAYSRKMAVNLRENYCFTPWATASTLGAIMLLILTTIQTVLAFKGTIK